MNYQKIYCQLIHKRKHEHVLAKLDKTDPDYVYVEEHHIVPRCIGGSDDKSNLVNLTGREHFIAHKLLFKASIGTHQELPLANAFWQMCYCHKDNLYNIKKTSRQFAKEKNLAIKSISKQQKNRIRINDGKHTKYVKAEYLQQYLENGYVIGTLQIVWNKGKHDLPPSAIAGKHHTLETRRKISAKCKGLQMPVSMKEKTRQRMLGNTYGLNKHPTKEALKQRSKSLSNRVRINNGQKMKYVTKDQLQEYLDNGWKLGMLSLSEETKQKLSQANKGSVPANKGKKLSTETRLKMSLAKRGKPPNNKGKHYKQKQK